MSYVPFCAMKLFPRAGKPTITTQMRVSWTGTPTPLLETGILWTSNRETTPAASPARAWIDPDSGNATVMDSTMHSNRSCTSMYVTSEREQGCRKKGGQDRGYAIPSPEVSRLNNECWSRLVCMYSGLCFNGSRCSVTESVLSGL